MSEEHHFKEYTNEPVEKYYEVHKALGKGAFSTVYHVVCKETGKEYALKVMDKPPKSDEGKNKIINIEIEILKRLNHPNCVKLFAVFNNKDKISLVIQLITGGELFERIIELQSYSEEAAARLVRQLLEGLAHMHSKGVIHRDLKPENLLLSDKSERARVVITDFGLSDIMRPGEPITGAVGTPGYLAPEILIALDSHIPYGPEVDMFGVGVITYILLSGIPPFYGHDEEEIYQKTEQGAYSFDMPGYFTNTSQNAKDFIDALLTLDRNKRLTAKQALKHTWLQAGKASTANMADTLKQLKRYQAKRKFQAAVKGLLAINKLKRLTMSESLLESIESKLKEEARRDDARAPFYGPVIFTGDGRFENECNAVKKILQKHGCAYLEVKVSEDARYNVVLRKLGGGNSPPQVFLGKEVVGGLEELKALDESGVLKEKLAAMPGQVLEQFARTDFVDVEIESGKKLAKKDLFTSDPYVTVGIVGDEASPQWRANGAGADEFYKTVIKKNTLNPKYNCVPIQLAGEGLAQQFLRIECNDHDKIGDDDFMGIAHIDIGTRSSTKVCDVALHPRSSQDVDVKVSGSLALRCEFHPAGSHKTEANPFRQRAVLSKRVATHAMQRKFFGTENGRVTIPKKEKVRTKSKKFSADSLLADILTPGSGFVGLLLEEPILTQYYPDSISKVMSARRQDSSSSPSGSKSQITAKEPQAFILKVESVCMSKGTEQASMCWLGRLWNPFEKQTVQCKISEQRQRPTFFDDGDFVDGVSPSDIVYLLINDVNPTSRFQVGLPCVVTGGEVAAPRELIHFSDGESRLPIRAITDVVWTEHALL